MVQSKCLTYYLSIVVAVPVLIFMEGRAERQKKKSLNFGGGMVDSLGHTSLKALPNSLTS